MIFFVVSIVLFFCKNENVYISERSGEGMVAWYLAMIFRGSSAWMRVRTTKLALVFFKWDYFFFNF